MKVQLDAPQEGKPQEGIAHHFSRRLFMQYSIGSVVMSYSGWCLGEKNETFTTYKIDSEVKTTVERMLSFSIPELVKSPASGKGLAPTELHCVSQYKKYQYGNYAYGPGLPIERR